MKRDLSIEIGGMHCQKCAEAIKHGLLKLDGVLKAEVSFAKEQAKLVLDDEKTSLDDIEEELLELGYELKGSQKKKAGKTSLKQGIVYGLVPHIGCIGFIVASVLGVTIAIEFFKPLLMNPWFFHILVLISIGFATLSSAFYLRKNGILSIAGIKRKKKYLGTMYGSTVGINLVLFLVVFPLLANLDTGSFAYSPTGAVALAGSNSLADSILRLQVDIPCPGHAPLISGELKGIEGVTGVRFDFPNFFDVAFDSGQTSKQEILSLEVFETYPARLVDESTTGSPASLVDESTTGSSASLQDIKEVEEVSQNPSQPAGSCGGTCGGSCGGCGCGAR